MYTISQETPLGRARRNYSISFKADLVEQCRQVGVSCSAVAISHGMNPNVLRRWIKEADHLNGTAAPALQRAKDDTKAAFVELPMAAPLPRAPDAAQVNVRIDIRRNGTIARPNAVNAKIDSW
jgi:transposase